MVRSGVAAGAVVPCGICMVVGAAGAAVVAGLADGPAPGRPHAASSATAPRLSSKRRILGVLLGRLGWACVTGAGSPA
jgi:hypothetical protein